MLCAYSAKLYILNTVLRRRLHVPRTSRSSELLTLRVNSMHGLAQRTLNCKRVNVALGLDARTLSCSQQQCAPLHLPRVLQSCDEL